MSTSDLSLEILANLGGMENIESMSNCKTRIRVDVRDIKKVDIETMKKLYGVIGVVPFGSQIQVVLGERTQEITDIFFERLKIRNTNK